MLVFLNGQFVPDNQAVVSVFDRGFLYGDGLFETMRVRRGRPFRWDQHLERLRHGADFLKIQLPFAPEALGEFAGELISRNRMPEALLRLTLSRGSGRRGYSPKEAGQPVTVMTLHSAPPDTEPPRWKLIVASVLLPAHEPLAQFKTCNKLPQILARAEADAAGADEALLLNTDGFLVEASSSNLFWIDRQTVCTAPIEGGILAGVTRAIVLELCGRLGLQTRETGVTLPGLHQADGVFLSLSSWGVVEAESLNGQALARSPLVEQIRLAYQELLLAETE